MDSPARAMTRMAAEIIEIPARIANQLADGAVATRRAAGAISAARPRWFSLVGRGTSDHAATYGRYLLESHLGVPVALAAPSLTTVYGSTVDWRDGVVIALSQSGRSPDVVRVVEAARAGGAVTIAITNVLSSPLATAAEHLVPCLAGEELAVAATKTYVAELVALAALVAELRPRSPLAQAMPRLGHVLERCLERSARWMADTVVLTSSFADSDRALVASRGYNLATALEIALKLKETAAVFADGYSTADLLHGPIALAGPAVPVLVFRPDGPMGARIDEGIARAEAAGSAVWVVGGREVEPRAAIDGSSALALPLDLPEPITPPAFALPGQLLAEAVARARGRHPDEPLGLTKVTLTR